MLIESWMRWVSWKVNKHVNFASIHNYMNIPKIEFITYIYILL